MDLATIEMDKGKAREAFLAYRREVWARHDAEDEAIMRGYRALSRGHQLIRLSEALGAGGVTTISVPTSRYDRETRRQVRGYVDQVVPVLAVSRADTRHVWTYGVLADGRVRMQSQREPHHSNKRDIYDFGPGTFEPDDTREESRQWSLPRIRAIVPIVPPPLRPRDKLGNYHVLFEAEWGLDPAPPVDPALLKHVGGDLYAVVAVWDLSPVERAVLALRPSE